jgi:hypothetical protein
MGLGATDMQHFTRPSEKPGEDENIYALHSTTRRWDSTSAENGKGTRLREVNQGGHYKLLFTRGHLGICQPTVRGGYQFHNMWDSS